MKKFKKISKKISHTGSYSLTLSCRTAFKEVSLLGFFVNKMYEKEIGENVAFFLVTLYKWFLQGGWQIIKKGLIQFSRSILKNFLMLYANLIYIYFFYWCGRVFHHAKINKKSPNFKKSQNNSHIEQDSQITVHLKSQMTNGL